MASETLADIVAKKRKYRDVVIVQNNFADRIEAAAKRELADFKPKCDWGVQEALNFANTLANHGWTREANSDAASSCIYSLCRLLKECGNAAAMREALCEIVLLTVKAGKSISCDVACGIIASKAKHALAEPARNCDVGTAEEQAKRLYEWCSGRHCVNCQFKGGWPDECKLRWAQMPYEEEKGGAE